MKEIDYSGDFIEDIENIKDATTFFEKVGKFVSRHFRTFSNLILLGYMAIILVNFIQVLLGGPLVPCVMFLLGGMSLAVVTRASFKQVRTLSQSEKELLKLRKDLSENYGVSISRRNLKDSSIVKWDEEILFSYNKEHEKVKEEKIIRYFGLLDREDQIQVLKHVQSRFLDQSREGTYHQRLFLLEKEDLDLENVKVKKLIH